MLPKEQEDAIRAARELNAPGEHEKIIIHDLPDEYVHRFNEMSAQWEKVSRLRFEAANLEEIVNAHKKIFWDDISRLNEQAETSKSRGKSMGIRKMEEGKVVIVEFSDDGMPVPPFIRLLQMMRETKKGDGTFPEE